MKSMQPLHTAFELHEFHECFYKLKSSEESLDSRFLISDLLYNVLVSFDRDNFQKDQSSSLEKKMKLHEIINQRLPPFFHPISFEEICIPVDLYIEATSDPQNPIHLHLKSDALNYYNINLTF